ncbi:MAG TPA: 4-(cytidine 5'-diphospho)-2-C-methyl-D-erythritol kinase [Acidiferrobacterales bacterium]|nr:4-(cytidine 5'-diphospho)-2-C-methyl-D-erythritol kinase [Acidiferrobacterales bacterium]
MTASWPAPAKLNLFLHVTGRRPDGYHTLQTLFQFLDVGDELRFDLTRDGRIVRARELAGVPEERDLCVRAARLLQAASGSTQGVVIHLDKRLPLGGGLGGGSSDAATTLLVLNELWGCGLKPEALAALGLTLGADVPVFVRGHAAWAEGVGEMLTPADPPERWVVVLAPAVAVSTAQVFAAFDREHDLTPYSPAITIRDFHAGRGRNDLEPVVRRLYPEVDNALKWLGKFGDARMTGSGACVFLPVADEASGRAILAQRPAALAGGFVARGRNVHPLRN